MWRLALSRTVRSHNGKSVTGVLLCPCRGDRRKTPLQGWWSQCPCRDDGLNAPAGVSLPLGIGTDCNTPMPAHAAGGRANAAKLKGPAGNGTACFCNTFEPRLPHPRMRLITPTPCRHGGWGRGGWQPSGASGCLETRGEIDFKKLISRNRFREIDNKKVIPRNRVQEIGFKKLISRN